MTNGNNNNAEEDAKRFECLKKYLITALTLEALRILRNLLVLLKQLLTTYLYYMVIDKLNKELEEFLMSLRLGPYEQLLQTITNLVNNVGVLFPPDALQQCLPAGEMMNAIYSTLDKVAPVLGKASEWGSRYQIANNIENYYMETIQQTLDYIDVMIFIVDDAIATKGG